MFLIEHYAKRGLIYLHSEDTVISAFRALNTVWHPERVFSGNLRLGDGNSPYSPACRG